MSKVPNGKNQRTPGGSNTNNDIEEWNVTDIGEKLEPSYQVSCTILTCDDHTPH
jgi:hypothetical protein